MLERISNGRTVRVFEYIKQGGDAAFKDANGVSLLQWCAYYGDVSAMRLLLSHGELLQSLGENFDLNGAAFHGHWKLCQFLIEQGANVNTPLPATGETPLHSALCTPVRTAHDPVVEVLLLHGANPNSVTKKSIPTDSFMRDCRTKAETPLHRAAAFGNEKTIQLLLDTGARRDVKDMNGDSPLTWASWYQRPVPVLRMLCYGEFSIHPEYRDMQTHLMGKPTK